MKKTIVSLLALSVVLGFSGNVFADDTAEASAAETAVVEEASAEAAEEEAGTKTAGYLEVQTTAHIFEDDVVQSVTLRFYGEHPNIPYISLNEYYHTLTGCELETDFEGNTFTFTTPLGGEAVIDTESDTLYSADFDAFNNTTIIKDASLPNTYYDGAPFVRVDGLSSDKDPNPKTIDFNRYNIDLIEDEDWADVWLPALTASDLFSGATMYQCMYDGKDLHFTDYNSDYSPLNMIQNESYIKNITDSFGSKEKRSKELAEFGYYEFCFAYDTFFGYPGRVPLESDVKDNGLDYALQNHSELTAQCREWLMSEDPTEFLAGAMMLDEYLCDGGHSMFTTMAYPYMAANENLITDAYALMVDAGFEYDAYASYLQKIPQLDSIMTSRQEIWGDDIFFIDGDTAVYRFDEFKFDGEAWKEYYKNGGDLPDDVIGSLKKALDEAKADPNVKNFVFDISANGGGSADIVVAITAFMTGDAYIEYDNVLSGQQSHVDYQIDTNFNGIFGDDEDMVPYDFNFGLLTSDYSFSCGNLLPSIAHDKGIALMGVRSGGGACAVYALSTPEGSFYQISSPMRLINKDGSSIDDGIPVDFAFTEKAEDGSFDYSKLYDTARISRSMAEFYGTGSSFDAEEAPEVTVTEETPAETAEEAPAETPAADTSAEQPATGNAPVAQTAAVMALALITAAVTAKKRTNTRS